MRTLLVLSLLLPVLSIAAQTQQPAPAPQAPAVVPTPPPADAEPQGFGDLKFGEPIERLKTVFGEMRCRKGRKEKDGRLNEWCELHQFKLGEHTTSVHFDFLGGKFWRARVVFPSHLVDEMKELLITKYGPTSNVEVMRQRESTLSHALTPDKPVAVYEWTVTKWEWANARVHLVDQRMHELYSNVSRFEVAWISPEEKAEKEKALKAF